ncbi:MAG: S-layer protein, partial [Planctomycetia bacterium]|nr:S-layer protein [Planctomycetia bacterium]
MTLTGPAARQAILVERQRDGKNVGSLPIGDAPDAAKLASSRPEIVEIVDGVTVPKGNGTATITAQFGNQTATAEVTVADQEKPWEWSFRNHVESVFTKIGCNSGACHGAALGKKGFRLTLRGYDPDSDYASITR